MTPVVRGELGFTKGAKGQVVGVHGRHIKRLDNKQSYTSQLQAALD